MGTPPLRPPSALVRRATRRSAVRPSRSPVPGTPGVTSPWPAALLVLLACLAGCGGDEASGPPPRPAVEIVPVSGPGGTWVDVRARGFPTGDRVELGLGPPESEYQVVQRETVDGGGRVAALMQVPDWAAAGERYVFVVATLAEAPEARVRAVSAPFSVDAVDDGTGDVASVTGRLTAAGVECPTLETDDGTVYTLTGDLGASEVGDRIEVFGVPVEMSVCMQGVTLRVDSIRRTSGPRG